MKIAHLVTVFPPYKSGIGNVCYQEVVGLAELGHKITVFTPDYNKEEFSIFNFQFSIEYLKPILKYGNAAFVPSVVKYLNNFDIIHLHYPFIGAIEPLLLTKIGKPLIVQYHMDLTLPRFCSFLVGFYNQIITKNIFKKANKIIISSRDYAENSGPISDFFKKNKSRTLWWNIKTRQQTAGYLKVRDKEKFIELPYGVDINKFKPQSKRSDLLKKFNLTEKDKIILFVGGLDKPHYFKGIDVLLRAVLNLKYQISNLNLIIVGRGNQKIKYERLAKKLGIENKVIFVENVENQELPDYYNLADVFVLPSINRSESFGIVLLEAMACGKPCVASNLPGLRTVVDDAKTGFLVEPKNVGDLADKISNLLENETLANKMGEAGLNKVRAKYDLKKIVHQLENLYSVAIFHDREK